MPLKAVKNKFQVYGQSERRFIGAIYSFIDILGVLLNARKIFIYFSCLIQASNTRLR